ncbi:Rho guanine nucleotide exchange factor [Quillaja saponaria]|uniref:Rho guanine nucleotide exchange factor n=1 Tax=Quillaja saponaria TaxID=32244 RepID=A0AAD7KRJ6_QUISA|nr:Rho guanine nucleotide exchange factor [Quillaja saponaria]
MEKPKQFKLNPCAKEFHPVQTPEESRTLFLTLSIGHPLTKDEIVNFFTENWGQVVEDAYFVEESQQGGPPLNGKIIFNSSLVVPMVLNGKNSAKFIVNNRNLYARTLHALARPLE